MSLSRMQTVYKSNQRRLAGYVPRCGYVPRIHLFHKSTFVLLRPTKEMRLGLLNDQGHFKVFIG